MTLKTVKSLLSASDEEQRQWIEDKFPRFEAMAYDSDEWGDTSLGMIYLDHLIDVADYADYPDDYGTFEILRKNLIDFSDFREKQIAEGSPLTKKEALVIKRHEAEREAESGIDGWISVHGWDAQAVDGKVFVVALGYFEGQGGIRLDDAWLLGTRDEAQSWLKAHEIWSEV